MNKGIWKYLAKARQHRDMAALQSAYRLIKEKTGVQRSEGISSHLYVDCAEVALQLGQYEMSALCLRTYFEGNPPPDHCLCRAYLCQGQLDDVEEAVMNFLKAIEISKKEPSCNYMVFNASVLYFQKVRPLLRPGQSSYVAASLRQVLDSLEEVADPDHFWRAELMIHLVASLIDAKTIENAVSYAKIAEDFIKSHVSHLYPRLFTLLVQHKLFENDVLLETSRQSTELEVIYKMQHFKSMYEEINKYNVTKDNFTKLEEIFALLVEQPKAIITPANSTYLQNPAPIEPSDRIGFLLELALLALQVKHQKVAVDCLKELRSTGKATKDQQIITECVISEITLLEKKVKMGDYSRAAFEAQLCEIHKLDQLLQTSMKEASPHSVQAVCVIQWNTCLALLQHNLRNQIKKPLQRVSQALENIQSMFIKMRCQVHSELASIEEEEGHLEVSFTHLQKALMLDNGSHREHLSSSIRLLQLRLKPSQSPLRVEDQAALLMEQVKDKKPQDDCRDVLVAIGLLLASDDFLIVLNADDTSKIPVDSVGPGPASQLAARAQHHSSAVQNVKGYLAKLDSHTDRLERLILWTTLTKTSRKLEVWDVCRAACQFCLLYDDNNWNNFSARILAEVYFISAEATIQKLFSEGVQLNNPGVLPKSVSETDPEWIMYTNWIQALSALATSHFLRAGELGEKIGEPGIVVNTATYLWNYNNHLLAAEEYQPLLPAFQTVLEMLKRTGCSWNSNLYVLLCDAIARGIIQPNSGRKPDEIFEAMDKSKDNVKKDSEVLNSAQNFSKALKLCEDTLRMPSGCTSGKAVSITVRKKLVTTWVQVKRLLQQQIDLHMDVPKDESEIEDISAVMRVLVGVAMFQCNRKSELSKFSVPSVSTLVNMASECSWPDALVELEMWCQLAAFCHDAKEHCLVLSCSTKALQLEKAAVKALHHIKLNLYDQTAVNELLSKTACLRGLSLLHESRGNPKRYRDAMMLLFSSFSFAEKVNKQSLSIIAAKHYLNACLPLTKCPKERSQLQVDLEKILCALPHFTKHDIACSNQNKVNCLVTDAPVCPNDRKLITGDNEHFFMGTGIYMLLYQIHVDKGDFASALQLLDKALMDVSGNEQWLTFLKYRILVKIRLGQSIQVDMQRFQDQGEQYCSQLWHQVALCAETRTEQQQYYQKAITCLVSPEWQWQKINLLLEFGGWLYCQTFSKEKAQQQIQRALQILQDMEQEEGTGNEVNERTSLFDYEQLLGDTDLFTQTLSSVRAVRHLDFLVQVHTILAVMTDRTSPDHQVYLIKAYICVLRIWEVSMQNVFDTSTEIPNSPTLHPPPSAGSKKGGNKSRWKKIKNPNLANSTPADCRAKPTISNFSPPSTLRDFAYYVCPDQARKTFRSSCNPHSINRHSITKGKQSLHYLNILEKQLHSLSLTHMTLPILHLAETISHDILDERSLSDFYRLKIVSTCEELGFVSYSPYEEKLEALSTFQVQEQIESRKTIILKQKRRNLQRWFNQADVMLDKAEVCRSLGLYQSAWQHVAEAHLLAKGLDDLNLKSRTLLFFAKLACKEQDFTQALMRLQQAKTLGGDEMFWYQFTITSVMAVGSQRDQEAQNKVDEIIKKGCEILTLLLKNHVNQVAELTFLITSLKMRGAVESMHIIAAELGVVLSTEAVKQVLTACNTLGECASAFTKINYQKKAAEAHEECAYALRFLANHIIVTEEKHRVLLDGLYQMEQAVAIQQLVALNAISMFPSQEEKLMHLHLAMVEFCLLILEEHCLIEMHRTLNRTKMTALELALEEFTHSSPEPETIEEEWINVGKTLGQMIVCHLTTVSSYLLNHVETKAHSLSLLGKYLRLIAMHEDPVYMSALWDSETKRSRTSDQLCGLASKSLAEASGLCLQHNLSSSILAEAALNMLECHGQSDVMVTGQYLALFQSCCAAAVLDESNIPSFTDTRSSQHVALLDLRKNLLQERERSHRILKRVEKSLAGLFKGFNNLSINPNHLSILTELPPNQKILLLQHSQDRKHVYGAFYEMIPAPLKKKAKVSGSLVCSSVAKVSVPPPALLALTEQTRAYVHKTRKPFQLTKPWERDQGNLHSSDTPQTSAPHFTQLVKSMNDYLNPLLTQLNIFCPRPQPAASLPAEMTKTKDGKERDSSGQLSANQEDGLVILADQLLHELPLELLSVLQEGGQTSVSKDVSLQHVYSRLSKEVPQVERDNRKDTKGGKGPKGKGDQGQAIKAV